MRVTRKSITKEEGKMGDLVRDVSCSNHSFLTLVAELQAEVASHFMDEFGAQGPIDDAAISKLPRIMSKYAASEQFQKQRKYWKQFQSQFNRWQQLREEAMESAMSRKKEISEIPAKLCFIFFFNGELSKAVVCLLDYVELVPDDISAMEAAFRWMMFLGETELAEKKMEAWRTEKTSGTLREVTRLVIAYLSKKEQRAQIIGKLMKIRDRVKSEDVKSFQRYELGSFLFWTCSTLSNVPLHSNLEECEFPDRLSHLTEAVAKADSIVRNRIPGLAAGQFDNSLDVSIFSFLAGVKPGTSSDYINLGSSIAWSFEMRRELSLVGIASAQARCAIKWTLLNMRIALKSASHFRVLQTANLMTYYGLVVGEPGFEEHLKIMKASCINLVSADPIVMQFRNSIRSSAPSRCQSPTCGQERPSKDESRSATIMQELTDRMTEIDLLLDQSFHRISRSCPCNSCLQFPHSSTFAAEYMFSYCIHSDFSQGAMRNFHVEFGMIRERDMRFQALMHRDPNVRPRPNVVQNEIFGLCAVQWLTRKIESKDPADEESLCIFKSADRIVRYQPCRTVDLSLALGQLGRQFEFPQDCQYSWMNKNTSERPRATEIDAKRYKLAKMGMRSEMSRYAHMLYRDWRSRLFPYIGRTSEDPWEAAYAWAESTSIGIRNAVQQKDEKCRRGLVTISGASEFRQCVEKMPDDMTLVQIAMSDNNQIYLIKLHADREPIVMPLGHGSEAIKLMNQFQFVLDADDYLAKNPGLISPNDFWNKRKMLDAKMKTFVEKFQNDFLGVATHLLTPSGKLGKEAEQMAEKIHRSSRGSIRSGEAKEMVYLAQFMDSKTWQMLCQRFCEMRSQEDPRFVENLPVLHSSSLEAAKKDQEEEGSTREEKKYTYFVICSQLSHFCWERLPIFENFPYVGRQVSIHSTFLQLAALRKSEKQIPLQIDVQNTYYVLDPQNNLGETKRRMLEYINKFQWSGTVGEAPETSELQMALAEKDAFVYMGHGDGSTVLPRSLIKDSTCNAISLLMGCGSVRTTPQSHGFDGKSVLLDYAMAKCPLIVGCLWTVTDGEIDRFLMNTLDDCFERTRNAEGVDKLRQLSEAMHEARSKAKLKYLTGAAVVMYGLPVVSKVQESIGKENLPDFEAMPEKKSPTCDTITSNVLKASRQPTEPPMTPKRGSGRLASRKVAEVGGKPMLNSVSKTPKTKEAEAHGAAEPTPRMSLRTRSSGKTSGN